MIDGFSLIEKVEYPNKGISYFYHKNDTVVIIDEGICAYADTSFPYSLITDKQNQYMSRYSKVFRFLIEDLESIPSFLINTDIEYSISNTIDRNEIADASPLEFLFEKNFTDAYGMSSLKYLWKEYCISDQSGNNYFLDYLIRTHHGDIAVEENGIHYHHPQLIGVSRYRNQLNKQNTCALWGIKLYRFSTEDCQFEQRIVDDIKSFFGENTESFIENGILADRGFKLYDHQEITLEEIKKQREQGIKSFLIVFPTATGKSKIIEEDLFEFSKEHKELKALVLVPTKELVNDWNARVENSLSNIDVMVCTYSHMCLHYNKYNQDYFDYIVIDEAHHAVAPVLKRVIQYFTPKFLVGMTATDQRLDNKRLETVFGNYSTTL
ncbi:MAG: DEAD/DEAH box helicase family protein, partial [Firmicutes bacterium]|nr:DEAD/DEAH box helicase family protein [Bacillota bacterium]